MIFALALDHQDIMIIRGRIYNEIPSPVNLLSVCRQIYAETALLPYKLNFFAVSNWHALLPPFLKRRTQVQLNVMEGSVVLLMTDTADEELAIRNWVEYGVKYASAARRMFKDMNAMLFARLLARQRGRE